MTTGWKGILVAGLATAGALAVAFGGLRWGSIGLSPSWGGAFLAAAALARLGAGVRPSAAAWTNVAMAVVVLLLFSDVSGRAHHLGASLGIRVPFSDAWPWVAAVALALTRFLTAGGERAWLWLLVASEVALLGAHLGFTGGEFLTRDDHPAFLYRMALIGEALPSLVFYNPQWNGGYLATELIATGSLAPWLLGLPLWIAGPPLETFAGLLPWLFFFVVPWSLVLAVRLVGGSWVAAALAGLLALVPTKTMLMHLLVFGLYPFLLAPVGAVLAAACWIRLFPQRRGGFPTWVGLVLATSVALVWPMGFVILLPLVPAAIFELVTGDSRRRVFAVAAGLALLAIHVPWVWALAELGDSLSFASRQRSPVLEGGFSLAEIGETGRRLFEELHPLSTAFLLAAGTLALRGRRILWALLAWNLFLGVAGDQLRRAVGLERFGVPFAFFAAFVVALVFGAAWAERLAGGRRALAFTAALAVLVALGGAAHEYRNHGIYRSARMDPELERVLDVVRADCPEEGRVLIPGFSLHWMGGGHIAPLPLLVNRELIGNDFYHRRDYGDVVPGRWKSPEAFPEWLELHDVGCVLSPHRNWTRALHGIPEVTPVAEEGRFALFRVRSRPGRFLAGEGSVSAEIGRLVVSSPSEEVVLRYRWLPSLVATPPAELHPVEVADGSRFLGIRMNGRNRVVVSH